MLYACICCLAIGVLAGAGIIILLLKNPGNNFFTPAIEAFFIRLRNRAFKKLAEEKVRQFNFYGDVVRAQTETFNGLSNLQDLMIELRVIQDLEDMETERVRVTSKITEANVALQEKIAKLEIKNNQLH